MIGQLEASVVRILDAAGAVAGAGFLVSDRSYRPFADVLQHADLKLGPMNREWTKFVGAGIRYERTCPNLPPGRGARG
jgi:hypothetical protein